MKEKILVIIYLNLGIGGIQKRLRDVVFEMSQHYIDWKIYILLRRKSKEGFDSQIKIGNRVRLEYYPAGRLQIPWGFAFWITKRLMKIKPDIILTFLPYLSTAVILLKYLFCRFPTKVVINEGILTSRHLALNHSGAYIFLARLTYPRADRIIVPTRACKNDLVKNFFVPPAKTTVIPNWTCLTPKQPRSPKYDVLYIGRFHREKSPLDVVSITKQLLRQHPNIRVGMMGEGELLQELTEAITSSKLTRHIQILPFFPDVVRVLQQTKVLLVPSLAEGMPNVVLEAAMCHVPSVVNHFPGAEEVVRHGITGYVSETVQDAVKYIDFLLRHEDERRRMGMRAQRYVSATFSYKTQNRFIEELLLD